MPGPARNLTRSPQVQAKLEAEKKAGAKLRAEAKSARAELGAALGAAAALREQQASLADRLEALQVRPFPVGT